jgi:hypothetical protein
VHTWQRVSEGRNRRVASSAPKQPAMDQRAPQRKRRGAGKDDDYAPRKERRTAQAAAPALPSAADDDDDDLEVIDAPTTVYCTDVELDKASGEYLLYAVVRARAEWDTAALLTR